MEEKSEFTPEVDGEAPFRVTDLKQYSYCPRILYYHTVLPDVRPVTFKMEAGVAAHEAESDRERRRSLRTYGVAEGERRFDVSLYSPTLLLSGQLDMLIITNEEWIPVEYKDAGREGAHYRLQLYAYGRLLAHCRPREEERRIGRGFIYLIPRRQAVEVSFTGDLRREFEAALETMLAVAERQRMPAAVAQTRKCIDCEFRRFCNDVP